jgi:hypothetical protein
LSIQKRLADAERRAGELHRGPKWRGLAWDVDESAMPWTVRPDGRISDLTDALEARLRELPAPDPDDVDGMHRVIFEDQQATKLANDIARRKAELLDAERLARNPKARRFE